MSAHQEPFELRWGIIGTGLIASWFVSDLSLDPRTHRDEKNIRHKVQAIGSSSTAKGQAFVAQHLKAVTPSPAVYDSYEGVYDDPNVDVVYIATPHSLHYTNTLAAINAGKHVLCEKPMAINCAQAEEMVRTVRKKGVFLMEGVWTRFFPIVTELQRLLHHENAIGEVTRAFVDFGLDMPEHKRPQNSRLSDPALGAGALLDIGIYPLTWARLILGSESSQGCKLTSALSLRNGSDHLSSVIVHNQHSGVQAICTASYHYKTGPTFARIEGSTGTLLVQGRATSKPGALVLQKEGQTDQIMEFGFQGWGFFYEADVVARAIRDGALESDVMPLDETLGMMEWMDQIRKQNGLRYPQDEGTQISVR